MLEYVLYGWLHINKLAVKTKGAALFLYLSCQQSEKSCDKRMCSYTLLRSSCIRSGMDVDNVEIKPFQN